MTKLKQTNLSLRSTIMRKHTGDCLSKTANKNTKNSISSKQFADYFKAVNVPEDRFYQVDGDIMLFNERYVREEFQIMFNKLYTEILKTELITVIKQLHNGASSGPDLLLNEFLKNGSETLIHYLHALSNKLFQMDYFPDYGLRDILYQYLKKGMSTRYRIIEALRY